MEDVLNIEQIEKDYDGVLLVTDTIDEAAVSIGGLSIMDPRMKTNGVVPPKDIILHYSMKGIGTMMKYGQAIKNALQMGVGYSTEVVDYGDAITVKISYTNTTTSNSASQNFIILFNNIAGQCVVKSNSQRMRTCNSPDQAASYIRSKASVLPGKTSGLN